MRSARYKKCLSPPSPTARCMRLRLVVVVWAGDACA
jgi:hypothetical protein